jgi:hypothetical protein
MSPDDVDPGRGGSGGLKLKRTMLKLKLKRVTNVGVQASKINFEVERNNVEVEESQINVEV